MKQRTLLEVLFESEITVELILFLDEGAKKKEDFLAALNLNEETFFEQLVMLKDYYLINEDDKIYSLTIIGRLIVEKIISLLDILNKVEYIEKVNFNKCSMYISH
jgi:predicted transcriptional regulator